MSRMSNKNARQKETEQNAIGSYSYRYCDLIHIDDLEISMVRSLV